MRTAVWVCLAVLSVGLQVSCGESKENPTSPNAGSAAAGSDKPATGGHGPVVEGERFTTRVVQDPDQKLPVFVFSAPEKWHDSSRVAWNYSWISNPVAVGYGAENPGNEEAFYGYPAARYVWVEPNYGFAKPGQNNLGQIEAQPAPPLQVLLYFIQQARGRFPNFKVIGSKELPELPKVLRAPANNGYFSSGFAIKISYELNGHAVEEEFYCIPYSNKIPYDGPQGRSWQTNWGLAYVHSFRAPAGTLDRRRAVFAAIAKSFRISPAWQARFNAITAYLNEQFNRQLQAGYNQIAAAAQLSRQISANNDAMIASIDRQLQASRSSSSGETGGRSSVEKFDDYIRGVDTVDDPYYGTSQHSNTEQYHWTDGYGSYRHSNEASYNPNESEKGDWQLMQPPP